MEYFGRALRAQGCVDPTNERWGRHTAQCPHAPVTLHCNTCGGCRDALPGHYLCCDGVPDKCNHALLHVAGWGVITPVELEARPGSGALLLSIEPMLERQSACKRQIKGNH
jgi:hypothetical protein